MTLEATYDQKFELLDFASLCSHVSLASECHILQNVGTAIYPPPLRQIARWTDRSAVAPLIKITTKGHVRAEKFDVFITYLVVWKMGVDKLVWVREEKVFVYLPRSR